MEISRKGKKMRSKAKTNEVIIRKDIREQDGYKYSYTLLMHESRATASFGIPLYSIKVEMTTPDGAESSTEVGDVFADAGRAIVFYEKALRNLATPIDLTYLLEDETVR